MIKEWPKCHFQGKKLEKGGQNPERREEKPETQVIKEIRAMIWYLSATIFLSLSAMVVYVYFLKNGQFDDPEDVKYQMFRNEESEQKDDNSASLS